MESIQSSLRVIGYYSSALMAVSGVVDVDVDAAVAVDGHRSHYVN